MLYDALIVGGGPTGLSAALILGRCRRNVLVMDAGEPRNAVSEGARGFLPRDGTPPRDLLEISRKQLENYPSVKFIADEATKAHLANKIFTLETRDGASFQGRRLLLATGLIDQLPEIDGLRAFWGKSAFVCPICDGWEVQDTPLVAYGSGPELPAYAVELLRWSGNVKVVTPGPSEFSTGVRQHFQRLGIDLHESPLTRVEGAAGKLARVHLQDGSSLACRALFLHTTQIQHSPLPDQLGCRFTEASAVDDCEMERTQIPGLYVAGNASKGLQLAIIAAAEGAKAAFSINESLVGEDTGFWSPEDLGSP